MGNCDLSTWPYTSDELQTCITGSILVNLIASNRLDVPTTLVLIVSAGAV